MITEHTAWAQPTLVRMLDDRGRVKYKYGFSEVRQEVAQALALAILDGPPFDSLASRSTRDRQIASTKRYLETHPRALQEK